MIKIQTMKFTKNPHTTNLTKTPKVAKLRKKRLSKRTQKQTHKTKYQNLNHPLPHKQKKTHQWKFAKIISRKCWLPHFILRTNYYFQCKIFEFIFIHNRLSVCL